MRCAECGGDLALVVTSVSPDRSAGSVDPMAYVHVLAAGHEPVIPRSDPGHATTQIASGVCRARARHPGLDELERRIFDPWRGTPGPPTGAR